MADIVVHMQDEAVALLRGVDGKWKAPQGAPLARTMGAFSRFGEVLDGGGFVFKPGSFNPVVWQGLTLLGAAGQAGYQWVLADLLRDGRAFEHVEAVDLLTGEAVDIERYGSGYDEDKNVVPFSYEQVLAEIESAIPRGTQGVWTAVAARFPVDPDHPLYRHNPAWGAALFSHYAALCAQDLPHSLVDECLRRAGRSKPDGYTVADCIRKREEYYRQRDGQGQKNATEGAEVLSGGKGLSYRDAQRAYGNELARFLVARVPGMGNDVADNAAYALIWWMYHEAGTEMLTGAKNHDEPVPLNLTGEPD